MIAKFAKLEIIPQPDFMIITGNAMQIVQLAINAQAARRPRVMSLVSLPETRPIIYTGEPSSAGKLSVYSVVLKVSILSRVKG